ncbi:MAG: hypothetical protein IPG90_04065 [Bacteroidetes bacterium]|nr:hypothetical protein [Bacteroidota bacterium]
MISIPVKVSGTAPGVRAGGQLIHKLRRLKISALPKHLPDNVEIKIGTLEIGDSIRVRDMKLEGVEFLDSPSNVITAVRTTRAVVAETPVAVATTAVALRQLLPLLQRTTRRKTTRRSNFSVCIYKPLSVWRGGFCL